MEVATHKNNNRLTVTCYAESYLNVNATDVTSGAGTAYPYGAPEFTPPFSGVRVFSSVIFCGVFCSSFFVFLSFFAWPLCCLSFFD